MDMSKYVKIDDKKVLEVPDFEKIDKTEMYFFDADGNACDEEHAIRFVAKAYDKDGNVINESWGYCAAREGHKKRL